MTTQFLEGRTSLL